MHQPLAFVWLLRAAQGSPTNWRVVDEECFSHGTWVAAAPRPPPYPPRWGQCGPWVPYAWQPTDQDPGCQRAVARAETFENATSPTGPCEHLAGRRVLFVGDSLSYEQWESLAYLSGYQRAMNGAALC